MYIVMTNGGLRKGKKHSAWRSMEEAKKQLQVLKDYGYKQLHIVYDETVNCENGYYYV